MEILVLGDGRFIFAVLNAIASIDSYNSLAAVGALIGLALLLVKGITSPSGPQLNLAPVLISIVFFWIMFIPRVDKVMVTEVMPPPGSRDPRVYVVDNVPLGLAGAGFIVSNVGVKLADLYDTIMGRPEDTERIMMGGGLGRNLMLMSVVREMVADPRFGQVDVSDSSYFSDYRKDMANYMTNCVLPPVNSGYMPSAMILSQPLETGAFHPEFALERRYVRHSSQRRGSISCARAQALLKEGMEHQSLVDSFDEALSQTKNKANTEEILEAYSEGMEGVGRDGLRMQELIVGHMATVTLREAQLRGAMTSSDRQAITMLEEANLRRSTQWAAEENLFIRLLRPLVGFFEALFYALGPIMAFVMMLGPTGWSLLGKYLMLTVWVSLWFPMLAITNLYSKMKMEDFFASLGNGQLAPNDLDLIANEAMTTLGATSALVAATPALAMSLIYGGAVSMSYLAGRLAHNDVVDETKMTPQVSQVAPVHQTQGVATTNMGEGTLAVGHAGYTISESAVAQGMVSSAEARSNEVNVAAEQALFQSLGHGFSFGNSGGTFGSTAEARSVGNSLKATLSDREGMSHSEVKGADLTKSLTDEQMAFVATAHQYAKQQGISLGAAISDLGIKGGYSESFTKSILDTTQMSSNVGESERLSNSQAIQDAIQHGIERGNVKDSTIARATVAEFGQRFEASGQETRSTEAGQRLSNTFKEAETARKTYEAAAKDVHQGGIGRDLTDAQVVTSLAHRGNLDAFNERANEFFNKIGGSELAVLRENYMEGAAAGRMRFAPVEHAQAAANIEALYRGTGIPAEHRGEAAEILGGALGMTPLAGGSGPRLGNASAYEGIGAGAEQARGTRETAAPVTGPSGFTPEDVRAEVQRRSGGASSAASGAFAAAGQQLDGNGVGSGFNTFSTEYSALKDAHSERVERENANHPARQAWQLSHEIKAAQVRANTDTIVANNFPASSTDMFGNTVQPDAGSWAHVVKQMTVAADNYERAGFAAEAQEIRAAREETIGNMLTTLDREAPHARYPEGLERLSQGPADGGFSAFNRVVPDLMSGVAPGETMKRLNANLGMPGSDVGSVMAVRDALVMSGSAPNSEIVQFVDDKLPREFRVELQQQQQQQRGVELPTQVPTGSIPR